MNSKITLDQAIQHRKDIATEIYDTPNRSNNTLNLKLLFGYLRGWDAEILEHYEYRYFIHYFFMSLLL